LARESARRTDDLATPIPRAAASILTAPAAGDP
jgi:hypothetical protein